VSRIAFKETNRHAVDHAKCRGLTAISLRRWFCWRVVMTCSLSAGKAHKDAKVRRRTIGHGLFAGRCAGKYMSVMRSMTLTSLLLVYASVAYPAGRACGRALIFGGGGPVGEAWESGVIAGLAEKGVDLSRADRIIGTSAGEIVGARLASGMTPDQLAQAALKRFEGPPLTISSIEPVNSTLCANVPNSSALTWSITRPASCS
jgi:hypothetical protein